MGGSSSSRMEEGTVALNSTSGTSIYCSLVALVKAEYPFDNILQDKAARFLGSLEPRFGDHDSTAKLVTELVPSSAGSTSGFVTSILTLLSSPYSTVIEATFSFLFQATLLSTPTIRCRLVKPDLVTTILATVQPHTRQISENEMIIKNLITTLVILADIATISYLRRHDITAAVDMFNLREIVFQKVVIPSSAFVTFLISKRHIFSGALHICLVRLLTTLLEIGPFHRPTLDFVLTSPIVMVFSSNLSFVEDEKLLWITLNVINTSSAEWTKEGPEVAQSGKRMMQALFSEGFEDTLEQILKHKTDGIVEECGSVSTYMDASKPPLSKDSNSFLRTLIGCWECANCWCRRTDSVIASNRPEIVCCFGFVVLNAAVFDCHIVNRPLFKQFLTTLHDTL
ncbi:hypothetical protein BLNAU_22595 [Blattamonas nauphoetae]|uniref:Uncharacterized protein n=1 Tax=Blattamonas nauphoetae TaxID=2049346 RepID=A0ABQ9WSK6_9EUKA|nr:hypothetical protein BLNAU_22595 [Blattamonas nauphoetae]